MSKLLTIVVPVYKVEQYINKCLDSCIIYTTDENGNHVLDEELMNQLEVIIVNDGTPDNSAELSREYTIRYPQTFRQIDKENGGHGSAWNVGVKEATGKYLRFLDSDDWLTNLDKLMHKLKECEADLVFTDECVHYVEENSTETQLCSNLYEQLMFIRDVDLLNVLKDPSAINFRKCTYLTSNIQKQHPLFRERVSYDDTILFAAPFKYAKSFIAYNIVIYNLLRGRDEQSMNPKILQKKADQLLFAYLDLHEYIAKTDYYPTLENIIQLNEKRSFMFAATIILNTPYKQRKVLIQTLCKNPPPLYIYNDMFSKQLKRYAKWPFIIAYLYDEVRFLKHRIFRS
jgi:glycosyltransferase involved in cell wall biosynthesis